MRRKSRQAAAEMRAKPKARTTKPKAQRAAKPARPPSLEAIADLIGSVSGLPPDLAARKKHYLWVTGYGRKRHR